MGETRITHWLWLAFLLILTGCVSTPDREGGGTGADRRGNATIERQRERIRSLEAERARLEDQLAQSQEAVAAGELRQLNLEARLARLQDRYEELSRAHSEAVAEVVRAQAKLRGSVGQADAASNIAEAEIALSSSEALADRERDEIRGLLERASSEFEQGNYGGALYLSTQVKRRISSARSRGERIDLSPVEKETRFEAPLSLALNSNSNVRSGPGLDHDILDTLPAGTRVEGYSYKGSWVRVRLGDGRDGWIYQTLVKPHQPENEE